MSAITEVTEALRAQLLASPALSYCHDSAYEDADIDALIQTNKFPFFNITNEGWTAGPTDNLNIKDFERRTLNILIQFATKASHIKIAKQGDSGHIGIYEFSEDLWDTIAADPTLGNKVKGFLPGSSIDIAVVEAGSKDERFFIGAAEMRIKFYKDKGRK